MKLKLSIIIVNYNTGPLLGKCFKSLKETTNDFQNPSYEIIVVDNASTDESLPIISNFHSPGGDLRLIKNQKNVGFAKAVNQGIRKAKGKYILLLNPDAQVKDSAIKNLLKFAEEENDAGVVGAQLLNPDGSVQASVFRFPTLWRAFQEFWLGKRVYSKYAPEGNDPVEVDAVVGAAFLITPQALKKAGFLDERYFMYFEDLDYCRRVKFAGLKVYYLPKTQVVHYHGVSGRGLVGKEDQWRRLIPGSKIYHGIFRHYLLTLIIWSGQKWQKKFK